MIIKNFLNKFLQNFPFITEKSGKFPFLSSAFFKELNVFNQKIPLNVANLFKTIQ